MRRFASNVKKTYARAERDVKAELIRNHLLSAPDEPEAAPAAPEAGQSPEQPADQEVATNLEASPEEPLREQIAEEEEKAPERTEEGDPGAATAGGMEDQVQQQEEEKGKEEEKEEEKEKEKQKEEVDVEGEEENDKEGEEAALAPHRSLSACLPVIDTARQVAAQAGHVLACQETRHSSWMGGLEEAEASMTAYEQLQVAIATGTEAPSEAMVAQRDAASVELVTKCQKLEETMEGDEAAGDVVALRRNRKEQLAAAVILAKIISAGEEDAAQLEEGTSADAAVLLQELEDALAATEKAAEIGYAVLRTFFERQVAACASRPLSLADEGEIIKARREASEAGRTAEAERKKLLVVTPQVARLALSVCRQKLRVITEALNSREKADKMVALGWELAGAKAPDAGLLAEAREVEADASRDYTLAARTLALKIDAKPKAGDEEAVAKHLRKVEKATKAKKEALERKRAARKSLHEVTMAMLKASRYFPELRWALGEDSIVAGRLMQGRCLEDFTVDGELGEGARHKVLKCFRDGKPCVLKHYSLTGNDGEKRRLLRETKLLARLQHPFVVHVESVFLDNGGNDAYVEMPYYSGGNLTTWLAKEERGAAARQRKVRQAALGLAAVHKAGIAHGDIKPENIFVDGQGNAAVSDFDGAKDVSSTTTTVFLGTLAYMSPERLLSGPPTTEADVYSLGLILFDLAFPPAADGTPQRPLMTQGDIEVPCHPDEDLRQLLGLMLARLPEDRATMQVVIHHPYLAQPQYDEDETAKLWGARRACGMPLLCDEEDMSLADGLECSEGLHFLCAADLARYVAVSCSGEDEAGRVACYDAHCPGTYALEEMAHALKLENVRKVLDMRERLVREKLGEMYERRLEKLEKDLNEMRDRQDGTNVPAEQATPSKQALETWVTEQMEGERVEAVSFWDAVEPRGEERRVAELVLFMTGGYCPAKSGHNEAGEVCCVPGGECRGGRHLAADGVYCLSGAHYSCARDISLYVRQLMRAGTSTPDGNAPCFVPGCTSSINHMSLAGYVQSHEMIWVMQGGGSLPFVEEDSLFSSFMPDLAAVCVNHEDLDWLGEEDGDDEPAP